MKITRDALSKVIVGLFETEAYRVTKYMAPNLVIRATRRRYKRARKTTTSPVEVSLTVGRPNYKERQFVKTAKKAGESFPIKRVILQFTKPTSKKKARA